MRERTEVTVCDVCHELGVTKNGVTDKLSELDLCTEHMAIVAVVMMLLSKSLKPTRKRRPAEPYVASENAATRVYLRCGCGQIDNTTRMGYHLQQQHHIKDKKQRQVMLRKMPKVPTPNQFVQNSVLEMTK